MMRAGTVLVVLPGAEKVVESMDETTLLNSTKPRMLMIVLWDICDPGIVELNPHNAFGECLQFLVEENMDALVSPATTRLMFWNNATTFIQELKKTTTNFSMKHSPLWLRALYNGATNNEICMVYHWGILCDIKY
jgi:hypothetical protein